VAHVAVVTGKIALSAVRSPSTRITLTSGAVGEANDSSAQLAPNADPAQYTAWTRGRLVFHQTPVSDVLISMTRWYGYRFQVGDSTLMREVITVGLSTESSAAAFATLRQILDVDLSFDGDVVTLSSRKRANTRDVAPARNSRGAFTSSTSEVGR